MDDWKYLEIGNIPSDFRENNRYELQVQNIANGWTNDVNVTDKEDRIRVLHYIIDGEFKYRYRLKPLKSIRITQKLIDALHDNHITGIQYGYELNNPKIQTIDNRKVEIIGDDE